MTAGALRPIPADEARRRLAAAAAPLPREEVPLAAAAGRVLADPVVAGEDLPDAPRSAMDGFAVRAADVTAAPVRLRLAGAVLIGEPAPRGVGPGEAMAIPTGGHLPPGADAVVMVEQATAEAGEVVVVAARVEPGRNVIRAGEDLARGTTVLRAGHRLRPCDLAALAALGVTRVPVHRRPRVAVLSTGAEIATPEATPPPGKVRDANQAALGAGAAAAGCEVTLGGIVTDDPAALETRLRELARRHDAVIVSGGSSVGRRDHTAEVMATVGRVLFHGIMVRPGRPTIAAQLGDTLLLGVPGVPAAALVIFEVFVRPTLRRLGGEQVVRAVGIRARLGAAHQSAAGREDYLRVRFRERDGELWAEPLPGALGSLVAADGLVLVAADDEVLDEGDEVEVWPWS
jgi:molybdopterin molybdotransferase